MLNKKHFYVKHSKGALEQDGDSQVVRLSCGETGTILELCPHSKEVPRVNTARHMIQLNACMVWVMLKLGLDDFDVGA